MKKIFNFGFELMKTKLKSLGIDDLMKAKAGELQAKIKESGSEMFQKFSVGKDKMSAALQQNPQAAAAFTAAKGIGTAALSNENAKAAFSKFGSFFGTKKPSF